MNWEVFDQYQQDADAIEEEAMIHIVGAGMAGLLAANMLAPKRPKLFEKQPELPNNHSAVLRFRTSIIGDVLGIEFKKVMLIKSVVTWRNPVADSLAYSLKNTGTSRSDRSVNAGLVVEHRYIAPADLIGRMAAGADITYDHNYEFGTAGPIISTIPMNTLMRWLDYPGWRQIEFSYTKGTNLHACIADCDAYVSLIFPDPDLPFSRVSITGDDLAVEGKEELEEMHLNDVCMQLGIDPSRLSAITRHEQPYAKINPIDDNVRRQFMFWATTQRNIYSLGRFATWRPGLLLDDLVQDVRIIDKFINRNDPYLLKRMNMPKT